ncbi:MAG: hypothetical protein IJJ33_20235, partial [Victivallales bacterium]|nr:hypothetical protein [Victivallales bacterium]
YENGKLVDEAIREYQELNRDGYCLSPLAVHLVDSPDLVASERGNGYQCVVRWPDEDVVKAYSGRYCDYKGHYIFFRPTFVSEGPVIEDLQMLNFGTSDLSIPDNDRFRAHISATSPHGVREVILWDNGQAEPYRRFLPGGKQRFSETFDGFHVSRRKFIMEVVDMQGKRAWSWLAWTSIQENEFSRCSDNINTMPRGKWFGPPDGRHNMRALEDYMVGRDFRYKGLPIFPALGKDEGERPLVRYVCEQSSRYAQVVNCIIDTHYIGKASPNHDNMGSAIPTAPNEYYRGNVRHTLYTCRQDNTLAYLVEGDFEVLKDFTDRPVISTMLVRQNAHFLSTTQPDGTVKTIDTSRMPLPISGTIPVNGFACISPDPFKGAVGTLALTEGITYTLNCVQSRSNVSLHGYYGLEPRLYRKGEHIRYRYLIAVSAFVSEPGHEFISSLYKFGLGGKPAYTFSASLGQARVQDDGILAITPQEGAFCGHFSQADLPFDLPVKIVGLNPNWDAGLLYKGKNTLCIPVYQENEYLQRSVVFHDWTYEDKLYHLPFGLDGTACCQLDLRRGEREVFIGNLFRCDHPELHLTCVDTRPGKRRFEAHNPTDATITATVRNADGFPLLGEFSQKITVPAGSSVLVDLP